MTRTQVPENPDGLQLCPTGRRDRNCNVSGRGGPQLRAIQAWVVERKGSDLDAADVLQRAVKDSAASDTVGVSLSNQINEPAILALKEENEAPRGWRHPS